MIEIGALWRAAANAALKETPVSPGRIDLGTTGELKIPGVWAVSVAESDKMPAWGVPGEARAEPVIFGFDLASGPDHSAYCIGTMQADGSLKVTQIGTGSPAPVPDTPKPAHNPFREFPNGRMIGR